MTTSAFAELDFALATRDHWPMPEPPRQKIAFAETRAAGVRGLLSYCSDYHCSHWTAISGDRWPDDVRLSDLEPRFTCQACGRRGADVRQLPLGRGGPAREGPTLLYTSAPRALEPPRSV